MGGIECELGSVGYGVTAPTGTNFKSVIETATLRDPSEYASVTDGFGFGVTLASSTTETACPGSTPRFLINYSNNTGNCTNTASTAASFRDL